MLLELEDIALSYGRIEALHGISLERRRGRDRRPDRRQRRRQDHHHAGHLRPAAGLRRARSASTARTSPSCAPTCGSSAGLCQSPEGRGIFPGMTVQENLDMGAYTRRDKAAIAADLERVFELFPRLAERRKQVGRHAVRRRAADARGRPGADEPAEAAAASTSRRWAWRRMLIQQIFDIITEINQQGTTVLRGRAERAAGAVAARTGRTCWRPAGSSRAAPAGSCCTTQHP